MAVIQPSRALHQDRLQKLKIQNADFLSDTLIKHDWKSAPEDETVASCASGTEEEAGAEDVTQLTLLHSKYNERIRCQLQKLQQIQPQKALYGSKDAQMEKLDADKLIAFRTEFNQRLRHQLTRLCEERDRASEVL